MRGPELHTLLVTRPAPLCRSLVGGVAETPVIGEDPSGGHVAPAAEPRDGIASRRQLASGGYQVHNGRPAAPVVLG